MNKTFFLYAGIYTVPCGFSSHRELTDYIGEYLPDEPTLRGTVDGLNRAIRCLSHEGIVSTDAQALDKLLCADLVSIRDAIGQHDENALLARNSSFDGDLEKALEHLRRFGLSIDKPYVTVVDSFPKPFDTFNGHALCPDAEDERRYGIRQGIYFRRSEIRPYFAQSLLAHELIHVAPGKRNPELLAMGLEEGVADLLGSLLVSAGLIGSEATCAAYIHGRHAVPIASNWSAYLDHTRQAALLYHRRGLGYMVELLAQGRAAIHATEAEILRGVLPSYHPHEPNHLLDDLTARCLDAYPSSYVVTPAQRLLAPFIKDGRKLSDVCDAAGVAADLGAPALRALQKHLGLLVVAGDTVAYSNAYLFSDFLTTAAQVAPLRYRIGRLSDSEV